MTTTHDSESMNRTAKAARIAKTLVTAGINHGNSFLIDQLGMREMALAATPRYDHGHQVWTEASEQTWLEVKEIVKVFGG